MNKTNDYRKWTLKQLDEAIMYLIQYGDDLVKLDHMLAARKPKLNNGN